ncbi:MAG: hypothetical protein IPK97_09695 [Ahniella sp.]|nr:hypothetical protein [Ahniella sp.]
MFASLEDRLALQDLTAVVPVGLLVSKLADSPFIELNAGMRWRLGYANSSGAAFTSMRVIDVLPWNNDPVNSGNQFDGGFSGGQIGPLAVGEHLAFTTNSAPADINRNPNCVSNGGSLPDGQGACPAQGAQWSPTGGTIPAGTTAIRIDDLNGLPANAGQTLTLDLSTQGNRAGNVYENSFTAVAPGESLAVATTKVQVRVPAAELRGYVYADFDDNGSPSGADRGIGPCC